MALQEEQTELPLDGEEESFEGLSERASEHQETLFEAGAGGESTSQTTQDAINQ
jgi:hypothetical protein